MPLAHHDGLDEKARVENLGGEYVAAIQSVPKGTTEERKPPGPPRFTRIPPETFGANSSSTDQTASAVKPKEGSLR